MEFFNLWNESDHNFSELENKLKNDIKKYCNGQIDINKGNLYFKNQLYSLIDITKDMKNYFLIYSFIKNHYVSKVGNPTINEIQINIALYATIKNGNFDIAENFIEENENINSFLVERYISNINNYAIDSDTLDETRQLIKEYHNYFLNKTKNINKKLVKEKNVD